ncbi:hypothetical protein [Novosphingobium sp.]|uniref:hypothetical protein n=1 Tax=Novosphingobium sp. TaxID=1874826 RepID=UPI0038B75FEC
MSTETDVANLAAARIGSETRISSLDDDRPLARTLKAVWSIERRATIRAGAWNFAARRGALAQLADLTAAETYPYAAAFEMPSDALRLLEVLDPVARDDYQREGKRVLCNVSGPLYARWLIDVPEASNWDDDFAEAFACRLAWKCGRKIYGGDFDDVKAWKEFEAAISKAAGADAMENPPIEQEESDWILARLGGRI